MSFSTYPDVNSVLPEPLFVMKADMTSVHCVLFAEYAGEEHLFVGTLDGTVHIWNLQTRRRIKTIHQSENCCLSLHVLDNYLITQDKYGLVKLWQYRNENFQCIYSNNFNNLSFCKISVMKKHLSYLSIPQPESKIDIYTLKENTPVICSTLQCRELNGKKLGDVLILKIILLNDFIYVASMYESGVLILWNISNKEITSHDQLTNDTPMCFDFDSERSQGVCGSSGDTIIVFRLDAEGNIIKKKSISIKNPGTGSICIRPDKKILAAGCWDGKIRIFSWKSLKLLVVLDCHQETVLDVGFSCNLTRSPQHEYLLAGGSSDQTVSLWSLYN